METPKTKDCNCGKPGPANATTPLFYDKKKWGKCKKCMLIAAIGTLVGWLMYLIALSEPNMPPLYKCFVLVVPVPFSFLLIVHAIFRTLKRRRDP